jgi:two-component sensor histidine kinase
MEMHPQMLQAEALHAIGRELDGAIASETGYFLALRRVVATLATAAGALWVWNERHRLLVREAQAATGDGGLPQGLLDLDHRLAAADPLPAPQLLPAGSAVAGDLHALSLPLNFRGRTVGLLNLYGPAASLTALTGDAAPADSELLRAIAGQLAVFIHTKQRDSDSTLHREMHHRVKNNLQTVASLLRMQARRLDEISAEQALEESIRRVQAIALVHEALAQAEADLVDPGVLAQRVCNLLLRQGAGPVEVAIGAQPLPLVDSKQATALALVLSELVDNAFSHGEVLSRAPAVILGEDAGALTVSVRNDGKLPPGFDLAAQRGLGLTIVRTLVREELHGTITMESTTGATVVLLRVPSGERDVVRRRQP